MEFVFPWPVSEGEWLAFAAAVATVAFGFFTIAALLFTHFPSALTMRAHAAGLMVGVGLVALLMAQPLIYLALGAGWAFAALLQIAAMARHGRAGAASLAGLVAALVLAALPILHALGMV